MTLSHLSRVTLTLAVVMLLTCAAAVVSAADPAVVVDSIRRQTAQVRGLEPLAEVPLEIVEPSALDAIFSRELRKAQVLREVDINKKLLTVLGLAEPSLDLQATILGVLTEQITGFYLYDEKKMYLPTTATDLGTSEKITIAHEMTHALQDQHFDLQKLLPEDSDNGDRVMAIRALVEGDATMTMRRWGNLNLSSDDKISLGDGEAVQGPSRLDRAPLVLRIELLFPYTEGLGFAQALFERGGFAAVDQAFRDPPQSTEQIIHPEKYITRDAPRPVQLPPLASALGGSWRTLRTDVLGELDIRILIEQHSSGVDADIAGTGWGGDRYSILEDDDGRLIVVLSSIWDTEADAAEFYNAFVPTVPHRFGPSAVRTVDIPSTIRWSTPEGQIQILKTGDRVRLIFAPTVQAIETVAAQF